MINEPEVIHLNMKYLIALKWRGAINMGSIRYFDSLQALSTYVSVATLNTFDEWHIWEIFQDKPPRHFSRKESIAVGLQ